MDLRGAKSNVMSLIGTNRNRNCPLVALVGAWPTVLPQDVSCHADCSRAEAKAKEPARKEQKAKPTSTVSILRYHP